jgi:DNA-binding HxlR family transcriptional regulator
MTESGYRQFCPVAKGAEIVATRWTPLILRELMAGERSFVDIHRGIPLISRGLLAERLRQLQLDGIIEKARGSGGKKGHQWKLTPAGDALREFVDALGRWGLIYGRDKVTPQDYDSTVLMWGIRRRVDRAALPAERVVVCFDLSGVARCRTGRRLHWLVLEPDNVEVCLRDPGHPVDLTVTGHISLLVDAYLGHTSWREAQRRGLVVAGERSKSRELVRWLRFDMVVGRDIPVVPPAAARLAP